MVAKVLIKRTITNDSPPSGLDPGELAIEMGSPTRLWVGVPTIIDASGRKQLTPSGGVAVSETPPPGPKQGDLWYESDSGILWMYYDDGNSLQWIQVNGTSTGGGGGTPVDAYTKTESDAKYVELAGDNMTGTLNILTGGNLTVADSTALHSTTVTGFLGIIGGSLNLNNTAAAPRWQMELSAGAEDFVLRSYDDAGATAGTPLVIARDGGMISAYAITTYALNISGGLSAQFALNKQAGGECSIFGMQNFLNRWDIQLGNATPEGGGGSNSGSDFYIRRFGDDGAVATNVFSIVRANGLVTCHSGLNVTGDYQGGGNMYAGSGIMSKQGATGGYTNNNFNFHWTGLMYCYIGDTNVGAITFQSDYRIKKNVAPLPSMWDVVKSLNPIRYTQAEFSPPAHQARVAEAGPLFTADDDERWGFIAHELQETMIESAASGVKDSPDHIQSPNPFTLIAALTKALQEAMTRIEALEGTR